MDNLKSLIEDIRSVVRGNGMIVACTLGGVALAAALILGLGALGGKGGPGAEPSPETEGSPMEAGDAQAKIEETTSSYGEDVKGVTKTLSAAPWKGTDGRTVTFAEDGTAFDDGSRHAFAITTIRDTSSSGSLKATKGTTETALSILSDDGQNSIATLRVTIDDGGTTRTLTGLPFAPEGVTLTQDSPAKALKLTGQPGLSDIMGANPAALEAKVRAWASGSAPAATEASWDGTSTTDFSSGRTTVTLSLNDEARTKVAVTYDQRQNAIYVAEGK